MASTNQMSIVEGDWISGTSLMDEMFIGYVLSLNDNGVLKVSVTQCDHQEIVGTAIETKLTHVKKLPDYAPSAPEELRSLIELALMTHDKTWFDELRTRQTAPSAAADWSGKPYGSEKSSSRLFRTVPRDLTDR